MRWAVGSAPRAVRRARHLFGTVLRARGVEEKAALASDFGAEVLPGFVEGWLLPVIDRVFHVARAADAHRRMEANRNFGKIVMVWGAEGRGGRVD